MSVVLLWAAHVLTLRRVLARRLEDRGARARERVTLRTAATPVVTRTLRKAAVTDAQGSVSVSRPDVSIWR